MKSGMKSGVQSPLYSEKIELKRTQAQLSTAAGLSPPTPAPPAGRILDLEGVK